MATPISLVFLLFYFFPILAQSQEFIYNGFNQSNLQLEGATVLKPSGALRLTDKSLYVIGHAFYPQPFQFFLNTSSHPNKNISSFSTYFVFQIVPSDSNRGGHGLAFTVSPSKKFPGAEAGHYLGILNESNDGNLSNHIFAVEFDTVNGFQEKFDNEGNHVGVNNNTMLSNITEMASYNVDGSDRKEDMTLESGEPVQAWVDYDGLNKVLNVTISPLWISKPNRPLISKPIDLSTVLLDNMYVGFSAATGTKSSAHYILGWSFRVNGTAPQFDLNKLPLVPKEKKPSKFKLQIKGIAAGLLYLHEEWAQVVIHRDVKSSNVLIDGEMNGRLGDFGLARLYDHGTISHTTNVVGTIGYIAPELAQTGKASTSSDVFAYGVLLLEVVCGRGPIVDDQERGRVILGNWVIEQLQKGRILDAVDPNLGSRYVVEEMELVLGVGLLCSNPKAEARPSMREILRYLNGDDLLPGIDQIGSSISSRGVQETMSRFFEVILANTVSTSSHESSSIGLMSSSSLEVGR